MCSVLSSDSTLKIIRVYAFNNTITLCNFGSSPVIENSSPLPEILRILQTSQRIFVFPYISILSIHLI